jgi:hypothetical protein
MVQVTARKKKNSKQDKPSEIYMESMQLMYWLQRGESSFGWEQGWNLTGKLSTSGQFAR